MAIICLNNPIYKTETWITPAKDIVIKHGIRTIYRRVRISKSKDRQHNGRKKTDKQRPTKHTHKTKDRVTRTLLETGGELMCAGRVSASCSTR